jgi:hypothetical protein
MTKSGVMNTIINIIIFSISIYLNCKWVIAIQRAFKPFDDSSDKKKRKDELKEGIKYLIITIIYVFIVVHYLNNIR